MASDQQTIEALQQENQRLREQIAVISHERDLCQQQTTTSDITAHVLHPFLDGPVVLFKWAAREGWPVEYVSLNVARFGYTADDFLSGRVPYPTIVYPEDLERVGNEVATYSAEGRAFFEQEYRLLNADGEPRWIYDYTSIIRDSAGTVTHYVGYILDITERKQTGEALQWSQKLLQHVLDSVPAVAYVKDRNGQYMLVNQQYLRLFHLTPEQVIGKTDHDIFPPDIATALQRNDQQIVATARPLEIEELVPHDDGLHTYMSVKFPLQDDKGNVYATGGISTDTTSRKQQEDELRMFKDLIEHAPDGFAMSDMNGILTYVNPGYRVPLGWDASLVGQPLHDTLDEEPQRMQALMQQVLTEGKWQGELRYRRKDGSTFPGQASSFVLYDTNGQPQAMAGIMRDMTERKREEAEREMLQQQIIVAQRLALRELSTPLIPLSDDVVIMPLIGTIDSGRAQQVMEALLEGVAHYRAELVILDITGVSVVDTQVAQSFVQAAQAVRLLGAQVMLTGIGPHIAQTLVHLGVDLSGIQTRSSLQSGIAAALQGASNGA